MADSNLQAQVDELVRGDRDAVMHLGDRLELLAAFPDQSVQLIITSPPYNIGKDYERKRSLDEYVQEQIETITACHRVLRNGGSICWQVGNHVNGSGGAQEVYPLDIVLYPIFKELGLRLRNRVVWHFEHGLHCSKRLSGRHEAIIWFTRGDNYVFNLDPIRVPQKYPGKKQYKGPRAGQYSCNPLGKNPGDVWVFPNVKHNHVEKTVHPCQFPVELAERFVLSCTNPGDIVLDPYAGVMTAVAAAVMHGRRGAGADVVVEYVRVGQQRVDMARAGFLRVRPMTREVYRAPEGSTITRRPQELGGNGQSGDHGSARNTSERTGRGMRSSAVQQLGLHIGGET